MTKTKFNFLVLGLFIFSTNQSTLANEETSQKNLDRLHECYQQIHEISANTRTHLTGSTGVTTTSMGDNGWSNKYATLVETVRGEETLLFVSQDKVYGVSLKGFEKSWYDIPHLSDKDFRFKLTLDDVTYHIAVGYRSGDYLGVSNVESYKDYKDYYQSFIDEYELVKLPAFELNAAEALQVQGKLARSLQLEMSRLLQHFQFSLWLKGDTIARLSSKNALEREEANEMLAKNGGFVKWHIDYRFYHQTFKVCSETGFSKLTKESNVRREEFNLYLSQFKQKSSNP